MSTNSAVFYQNIALQRAGEVTAADWDDGMNKAGSCICGLGINTGAPSTPDPVRFTLLDQDGAARAPQNAQHIGQALTALTAVQGADVNDTLAYATGDTQAADGVIFDTVSGAVNRTGATLEIGDTAWGTVTVA